MLAASLRHSLTRRPYTVASSTTEHFLQRDPTRPPVRITEHQAAELIPNNSTIYCHSVSNFPTILVNSLAERARQNHVRNLTLCHLHVEGKNPFEEDDLFEKGRSHHFFIGKNSRKAVNSGRGTYIPVFLSEIPTLLYQNRVPLDFTFLNVSPPDRHGYCSLGMEVCVARSAVECTTKAVIAQINPNIPRTLGNANVHINWFDYVVDVSGHADAAIPTVEPVPLTDAEKRIGAILAGLIPDGATLQIGIGGIPNATMAALKHHKDLGIHSEMISDGVMDLMQCGAVTNKRKKYMENRTVTSFLVGSQRLYDFVNDNPGVYLDTATMTNSPTIIAMNPKVVAINSALEVDLTGQVCADSIGTTMVSGVGGQLDFEHGAAMSDGGMPVICLASTTKHGQSTIVNMLNRGAGVTTTRYHAHWIVTENGAVNLYGRNMIERAKLLISIAAQQHREALSKQAQERFNVPF